MALNAAIRAALACGLAAVSTGFFGGSATAAETRSMFCMAVRTVPALDQNNYAMGGQGRVFLTQSFATDLGEGELMAAWRAFITDKHPATSSGSGPESCHPADTRRAVLREQHGDIRNVSVSWTPGKAKP